MIQDTEVLYNAQCPVCSFEIDHYRAYADKRALPLRFDDLNGCDLARWGLSADQAARRLYVRQGDQLLSGIPAFIVLWREMPRYRVLAKMASLPGIHRVSCIIYDHALAPLIYRWHLRRQAKAGIAAPSK
jgi:predicted DCC family thiol-disulfide oxidoreductase YuxK